MANAIYDKGRQAFMEGEIDMDDDNIKCVLVDTNDYTHNIATNDNLDDIAAGVVATSSNLASTDVTDGVFDATDVTFSSVTGDQCEAIVIYKDTTVAATSKLIAYIDVATGLPVTPNGGDITVTWDNGANKIFKL